MKIMKVEKVLSDQSTVYDVLLRDDDDRLTLECVSEKDANELIIKLAMAINNHTNIVLTA